MDYDLRGNTDRRGRDRRRGSNPNYSGPERRVGDRRHGERRAPAKDPGSKWPWIVAAAVAFFVWDAFMWDGHYRRHIAYVIDTTASDTRAWSASIWQFG